MFNQNTADNLNSQNPQFEVVSLLLQRGMSISTAESCTGGMISEMLTSVPNSSKVFEYGISAYSNRVKMEFLNVPEETILTYGAISGEVAMLMAKNVREISGSDIGVGISGNAGPSGSENKPVGLVYIAITDKDKYHITELLLDENLGRDAIRLEAANSAFKLLSNYLTDCNSINMIPFSNVLDAQTAEKDDFYIDGFSMVLEREESDNIYDEDIPKPKALFRNIIGFFSFKNLDIRSVILKTLFFISIITLIVSSLVLINNFVSDNKQREIISSIQDTWSYTDEKNESDELVAFEPVKKENPDVRGWITISGTEVNHPVYQTTDNEYYLTHNMNKEESRYGAIYFDYRCSVSADNPTQNVIVYGHDMKDGSMFGTLKRFKNLNFYKKNPSITLTKLHNQTSYMIFAVMIMNATASDDNGYLFDYINPTFSNQETFLSWINEARERSLINTLVDVKENDQILTIVTCTNDFKNARLVIMAREVRAGENQKVVVSDATLNPNPRYPQAWYDKRGLEGFNSQSSSSDNSSSLASSDISSNLDSSNASDSSSSNNSESQTQSNVQTSSSATPSNPPVTESQNSSTESSSSSQVGSSSIESSSNIESSSSIESSSDIESSSSSEIVSSNNSSSDLAESSSPTQTSSEDSSSN